MADLYIEPAWLAAINNAVLKAATQWRTGTVTYAKLLIDPDDQHV